MTYYRILYTKLMASQISHIVYAKKYLDKYSSDKINEDKFILGTVFPDIRYITENIKRNDTHSVFSPINLNFNKLTPFQAGWKFHLYCDIKREEILSRYNFYSLDGTDDFACASSKLLEDRIIYNRYNNWKELTDLFKNPPEINTEIAPYLPAEISARADRAFKLWYATLAEYISQKPDSQSTKKLALRLPALADKSDDIIRSIDKLEKNKEAVGILEKVIEELVASSQ